MTKKIGDKDQQTLVSIGVMIQKDGKVLVGKRKGSNGAGEWGFPGGHLEYNEDPEQGSIREVMEETGMKIKNIQFELVANVKRFHPKHYVYIGFKADWESGEPVAMEPDRCEGWIWCELNNMPEGVSIIPDLYLEKNKTGKIYFSKVE